MLRMASGVRSGSGGGSTRMVRRVRLPARCWRISRRPSGTSAAMFRSLIFDFLHGLAPSVTFGGGQIVLDALVNVDVPAKSTVRNYTLSAYLEKYVF